MSEALPPSEGDVAGLLGDGKAVDALAALKALAAVPSDDQEGYAQLVPVLTALADGRPDGAYFRLSEELEAPTDLEPAVYAAVGHALASAGHRELAASAWASAEDDALAERSLAVREDLGLEEEAFERRVDDLAVAHYRARVAADASDAPAWEALARKLLNQDMPAGALEAAEKAIALDPRLVWAWVAAGQSLARTGRPEDALHRLEEAARANPTRSEALVEAAALHLVRRNEPEALRCYKRALDRAPQDRDAQQGAREILRRTGKWEELARLLDNLATAAGDDEDASALRTERDELRAGRHRYQSAQGLAVRDVTAVQEPVALPTADAGMPAGMAALLQKPTRDPLARVPDPPGSRVARYVWLAFMVGVGGLFVRWLLTSH